MNVTMKTSDLAKELMLLEKVAAKKTTIPVLQYVLFDATNSTVQLSATDIELGLTCSCPADVAFPGIMALPVKRLLDLVQAQSDTSVSLVMDDKVAKFNCGKFESRLQTLNATEFPKLATAEGRAPLMLPRQGLLKALKQVRFAVSDKDQPQYYMKGILLVLTDQKLTVVATDTSRLALSSCPRVGAEALTILLPSKAVDELILLLDKEGTGDIAFASSDQHLFFTIDGRHLLSRQIEGQFPAYDRVIPTDHPVAVTLPREALIAVLRRHTLISEKSLFRFTTQALDIHSLSPEVGESHERVAILYEGSEIQIYLRGAYVLDFLNAASGQTITMHVKDALSQALFTDGDYLNVVMALR